MTFFNMFMAPKRIAWKLTNKGIFFFLQFSFDHFSGESVNGLN